MSERTNDLDPAFWRGRSVVVTGGAGCLGHPTVDLLEEAGADVRVVRSLEHDLRDPGQAREALAGSEIVIHLAANVGGIGYNVRNPARLTRDNLAMGINVFEACRLNGVKKLVAAGSVAAYPANVTIPYREESIWEGYPEPATAPYGLAKRMFLMLSGAYREQYGLDACSPSIVNTYGPWDNFDLEDSHVIAAMIRKYVDAADQNAEAVTLWGSGKATREFLYSEDAARGLLLCAERYQSSDPINLGSGQEVRISRLAELISSLAGFQGETRWDSDRPEKPPRRRLDVERAREQIGFEARVTLEEGLERTIDWYQASRHETRAAS